MSWFSRKNNNNNNVNQDIKESSISDGNIAQNDIVNNIGSSDYDPNGIVDNSSCTSSCISATSSTSGSSSSLVAYTSTTTSKQTTKLFQPVHNQQKKSPIKQSTKHHPKYPLADQPTPFFLQNFKFRSDGYQSRFHEVAEAAISSTNQVAAPSITNDTDGISLVTAPISASNGVKRQLSLTQIPSPAAKRVATSSILTPNESECPPLVSLGSMDSLRSLGSGMASSNLSDHDADSPPASSLEPHPPSSAVDDVIMHEDQDEDSESITDHNNSNNSTSNNNTTNISSPHMALPSPSVSPVATCMASESFSNDESSWVDYTNESVTATTTTITTVTTNISGDNKVLPTSVSSLHSSVIDIPTMISNFESLPDSVKQYVLFNMLKSCDRTTLSTLSGVIVPSLRCDFLSLLPIELCYKILSFLDFKTLCYAAQVSRNWTNVVDSSEYIWKELLARDEIELEPFELQRAIAEKWDYTSWGRKIPKSIGDLDATDAEMGTSDSVGEQSQNSINTYKAIYRRRYLINQNWMDPNSTPRHLTFPGHGHDVVTCLQFDDDKIVTGSDDHTINIYDTKTGTLRARLTGHEGGVWALQYVGNTLVSGSTDRTVRVWDIKRARCTHIYQGHTSTVRCLDILQPVQIGVDPETEKPIMAPEFPIIVSGSRDNTLRIWRVPNTEGPIVGDPSTPVVVAPDDDPDANGFFLRALRGHSASVRAISGHGDTVVSGSYDTTVRVWNITTGVCRHELTGHAQRVYSAVIDPKRNRCISGSMDWFVKVWCLETGSLLYTLEGHTSLVGLLDLNRTTLVSAAADSTLRVWDPDTGAFLHKLQGHQGAITCFQHDEYKVVSGSERTLKLWNIKTGELVRDLLDDLSGIWQVRFDHRRCVAAVKRNEETFIEVLDFDYDPYAPDHLVEDQVATISNSL